MRFGTAGLRGRVGPGADEMNVEVVGRTTAALAQWLLSHGHRGATVVVGRDARHGSAEFFATTVTELGAAGFDVVALDSPLPTPVLAFTTRELGAAAGVMITASHNPPADNGYKVYLDGGAQLIPPADAEIEELVDADAAPPPDPAPTAPHPDPRATAAPDRYLARIATRLGTRHSSVRIALTPMHGVGGDLALRALAAAGFADVVVVDEQFAPDPDFPTVAFPNPEEPGASDLLLALAQRRGADIAIALDPDADRCAVGAVVDGRWRMLTGDETGALLGSAVLAEADPGVEPSVEPLVASTIVSGSMLAEIAAAAGARHVRTLTGFKWLVRAGDGLRYAYEEAIGHCVDPDAVRDKDGISAAVALAILAHDRVAAGGGLGDALDDLFIHHGVHRTGQVAIRAERLSDIADTMARLRATPPTTLAGVAVDMSDHATRSDELRTDAVAFTGSSDGARIRLVARPSGTEPKLKFYLEVALTPTDLDHLRAHKDRADTVLDQLRDEAGQLAGGGS
ncbi:phosphoglucomutase [Williamsia phyllosphaerae]|uniref:Phosphoglucomutase n=1 Tax=Williamsia phyllosphaerae TaxID=885042 RepID=A0ABQ1UZW5_9NOCA|nr:phosphoglucomutase [Williamsia phyllosphaerae]